MNLRVRDNSIRLRLTRSEVELVHNDGLVRGRVPIPEAENISWSDSDEVSIAASQILDGGDQLNIVVEKDFACLAPREGEDETEMYPHPEAGTENS